MSDMSEIFQALKRHRKECRDVNANKNHDLLTEAGIDMTLCAPNTVKIENQFCKITFFLPSGKWQAKGKMFHGGATSFLGWLKNNEAPCTK
jgi:hypothetical protein